MTDSPTTNYTGRRYISGAMRDPDQVAFYHSGEWLRCRDGYIKSVGGLCERCMAKGIVAPGYIVHHRVHLTPDNLKDPNVLLSWSNLEYLCQSCHNLEHFGKKTERRYTVGADGKVFTT